MSTRLVAADIDLEEGVMLRLDFTSLCRHVGLPCLLFFFPFIEARVQYDLVLFLCTIQSGLVLVYDTIWRRSGV